MEKHKLNLNNMSDEDLKLFSKDRLRKMLILVTEYSYKRITANELYKKLLRDSFNSSVESKPPSGFVYVTDKKENKLYEFKY